MQKSEKYFMEVWIENPFPPKFAGEIGREVLKAAPAFFIESSHNAHLST
jgi:hypothetical protein